MVQNYKINRIPFAEKFTVGGIISLLESLNSAGIKQNRMQKKVKAFEELLDIMDELRDKCPWDKEQTLESLRKLTIEETYELADAILQNDLNEIKKELGDLMLHIVFYAKIGSENGAFDMGDVLEGINTKLIYRHPHVFGDVDVDGSARKVEENWEALKLKEKGGNKRVLEGVPAAMPALIKANRIQEKVSGVGFDWEYKEQVWDKVKEEINELAHEIDQVDKDKIEGEFGDLFFAMVNAARLYGVDPEAALERTNLKFMKRFNYLESQTLAKGKSLHDMSLAEMDVIWDEAKKME
ncbi:MAG TPA: nucleoside triphosphate pyrophosphohydrolase [Draconibacterium sp.]|nr:nucleoside triphosphate pyrophosphohydrolase [Draconibacterium sp.]